MVDLIGGFNILFLSNDNWVFSDNLEQNIYERYKDWSVYYRLSKTIENQFWIQKHWFVLLHPSEEAAYYHKEKKLKNISNNILFN